MRMIVAVSLLIACASASLAQDPHVATAVAALRNEQAKEGQDCKNARSQYEDNVCTAEVAKAADKNMTVFYDNLKALLSPESQEALHESQAAWLEYRSKACGAVYEFHKSGSIRYAEQARCETGLTRERMRDLDYLYEGPLHR